MAIRNYEKIAAGQNAKKEELRKQAEQDQKDYDAANFIDDQFDLSDALLAIAISLLALTALTHQDCFATQVPARRRCCAPALLLFCRGREAEYIPPLGRAPRRSSCRP
jgi:hypothetical protein